MPDKNALHQKEEREQRGHIAPVRDAPDQFHPSGAGAQDVSGAFIGFTQLRPEIGIPPVQITYPEVGGVMRQFLL